MNKETRNQLRSVVVQCRTLLERAVSDVLQGEFGIHLTGLVEPTDSMGHLSAADHQYREQILTHLDHIKSFGLKPKDAIDQVVREASFTHLNRLCAYKMMEKRELIRETVSRGLKSKGFMFYLADHPDVEKLWSTGHQDIAYRYFLEWRGATLSSEIGVLFSPQDLANRLFPPFRVLDHVLSLINAPELEGVWVEDEAIGWVYQYFTPKELRDAARDPKRGGSQAPRNSYELAFRNQFFTPRYVVEFLADNTLGRMWYEMRQGGTVLTEKCRYLVCRPREIFLPLGEEPPQEEERVSENLSDEEILKRPVYVKHRAKKDPREIKVLDPACGSGHFLLYCFDLLQTIYEEAYEDEELGPPLRNDYLTLEDLRSAVPTLILAHNLHGVDIDLRATQIAGLAVWLRCQRAYKELGIKVRERPPITKTNIVCAEPMPGEKELLEEFVDGLQPRLLGQLVRVVFEKMKLAGEAGSLLKIEEEISGAIAEARNLWRNVPKQEQLTLFQREKLPETGQPALFDVTGITNEQFWHEAEARVVESLREYAQTVATNGRGLLRRLFADDAAQGFAFVDICRKRFDVVLMNPPFGEPSKPSKEVIAYSYPDSKNDVLGAFVEMGANRLTQEGLLGAITSRTALFLSSMEKWRKKVLFNSAPVTLLADLGEGVLDTAMVKTAAYILDKGSTRANSNIFFDLSKIDDKQTLLETILKGKLEPNKSLTYFVWTSELESLPGSPLPYWASPKLIRCFIKFKSLMASGVQIKQGLGTTDDFQFVRTYWEVDAGQVGKGHRWYPYAKGGESQAFYGNLHLLVNWEDGGREIYEATGIPYGGAGAPVRNPNFYFHSGLTYTSYTNKGFHPRVLPSECIFTTAGMGIFADRPLALLALLNSSAVQAMLSMITDNRKWEVGYVQSIPSPQLSSKLERELEMIAIRCWEALRSVSILEETSNWFISPINVSQSQSIESIFTSYQKKLTSVESLIAENSALINRLALDVYDLEESDVLIKSTAQDNYEILDDGSESSDLHFGVQEICSYALGCAFGRWDVRYATGERSVPELPDPFAPLPVCTPGALTGADGLPLRKSPPGYPLRLDWDGILVDDPDHDDDIIRRVRDVFELLWQKRAEEIEREACELLQVKHWGDYFRKAAAGGFWTDHVKRYSKSRRKAPIYWYLRSSKGTYAVWLYYHRLDKDILFKVLLNYVEPKLRLEQNNLDQLRQQREAVGTTGRDAKQLERQLEKQESFLSELHDFRDKLKRAAELHLEPDLNDGVVLNIAPLWELVPWKEAEKYWKELLAGKYEWSSISKQLHAKGLIRS